MHHPVGMEQTVELIGAPEAARRLGVDRSTLTRWVKAGRIEAHTKLPHTNGALVFDSAAVDALKTERTQ
jgi:predicted site-specific integrase-resolvase